MTKISVIVPVYGVEKYIERCARSLFEQTLDDIEYLFIDDCTPDKSIEILKNVLEEYPYRKEQVIIHRMDQNSGQAAVRKWGIQNATGEYVIHCDSDDWVDVDMYRAMYEKAIEDKSDIVISDYYKTDGHSNILFTETNASNPSDLLVGMLLYKSAAAVWNKLVKREIVQSPKIAYPQNSMGEDMMFNVQYCNLSKSVSHLNRPLYYYFENAGSICKTTDSQIVVKRASQAVDNATFIRNYILDTYNDNKRIKCSMYKYIFEAKSLYLPAIQANKTYYADWKAAFKDDFTRILLSPYISLKNKIGFILTYFKVYPR